MAKFQPAQYNDDSQNLEGNRLISGRWGYITVVTPDDTKEYLRFIVNYITPKGTVRKAYSRSAFSRDIKEAIIRNP